MESITEIHPAVKSDPAKVDREILTLEEGMLFVGRVVALVDLKNRTQAYFDSCEELLARTPDDIAENARFQWSNLIAEIDDAIINLRSKPIAEI